MQQEIQLHLEQHIAARVTMIQKINSVTIPFS